MNLSSVRRRVKSIYGDQLRDARRGSERGSDLAGSLLDIMGTHAASLLQVDCVLNDQPLLLKA